MDRDKLMVVAAGSVVLGVGMNALGKLWERQTIAPREESSKQFQDWARKLLRDANASNADSVVFKQDNCWTSYGGGFIGVKKQDEDELISLLNKNQKDWITSDKVKHAEIKSAVLHENKHVQNYDSLKISLLNGAGFSVFYLASTPITVLVTPLLYLCSILGYKRYQEYTAEEYAYKNMLKDDLALIATYWERKILSRANCFDREESFVKDFSNSISEVLSGYDEKMFFRVHSFFHDIFHPDLIERGKLIQKILDEKRLVLSD
jgi:hypothetical protein